MAIKKEEGDNECRPFSLFALMAPLRQQQRKGQHKVLANPRGWHPKKLRGGKYFREEVYEEWGWRTIFA
jgi:hypothetical protein